jgi:hypothetical protein
MNNDYICPNPDVWNRIFKMLIKEYEEKTGIKLQGNVVSIRNSGGPPTPLILGGWDSSDYDKKRRWQDTIKWAEDNDLLYLVNIKEEDKYLGNLF